MACPVPLSIAPAQGGGRGPIGVSSNGHYFVDRDQKPFFWLGAEESSGKVHVAFLAEDRKTVDAFYKAAIAAGGRDNGKPGLRQHYHPDYYGAFVLDPDGHNIEAVCHRPA